MQSTGFALITEEVRVSPTLPESYVPGLVIALGTVGDGTSPLGFRDFTHPKTMGRNATAVERRRITTSMNCKFNILKRNSTNKPTARAVSPEQARGVLALFLNKV